MGKSALKFVRGEGNQKASLERDCADPITSFRPQTEAVPSDSSNGSGWSFEVGHELKNLLLKDCEIPNSPKTTIFGMSPPARSGPCGGAYNPLTLDRNWPRQARFAVHHNLQGLRERNLKGTSCRRTAPVGDPGLLITSPDYTPILREPFAVGAPETAAKGVPFTCQTHYFEPPKIK